MNEDRHYELTIPIGLRAYSGKGVDSEPLHGKIAKTLFREFKEKLANPLHCNVCGSIPFDLVFRAGARSYYFSCWKVEEYDNTLIETDYRKLGKYCRLVVEENEK